MTSSENLAPSSELLTASQCKAARALLGWNQQELAQRAKVGTSTVADFEREKRTPVGANIEAITAAFVAASIHFVAGGVQGPSPSTSQNKTLAAGSPMRLIDATDLVQWAARNDAKAATPELIERLILATTANLPKRLQFPSGDSVLQPGWDGVCEQYIIDKFEWLPWGLSGWELGTQGGSLRSKADGDYEKRTNDSLGLDQSETNFIFVTPRRWKAGAQWAREKQGEKVWKDVRVLDADDLVSWIALFPSVGYWFAGRIGKPIVAARPLEEIWREWRLSTKWPMSTELVTSGRDNEAIELLKWLYSEPTVRGIQGDSIEEGMAFLYAAVDLLPDQYKTLYLSRCQVVSSPDAARVLGNSSSPLVIIIEASEPGLAARLAQQGHHVLVVYGSQVGTTDLVNVLSRPRFEPFHEALEHMGIATDKAKALTRDSARRLSILRRLVPSAAGEIIPDWAEIERGTLLLPALLAGAWDEDYKGDRDVIEVLSQGRFETFSTRCPRWIDFPDAPLRHAGKTWKLASPYDAWFRLAGLISKPDLERFVTNTKVVLGANDPRFDLDADERWLSGVRGQMPHYSPWLISGITETLLLLAMFGTQVRAVPDASQYADRIVQELFDNADERRWWSLSSELRTLAEVSPDSFMHAVEDSLASKDKPIMVLFKEDGGPVMGRAYHSQLLWALETLAWSPDHISRASEILAQLATLDPGGRWANRPKNSLRSIFLLWLPQTNARFAERLRVIDRLRKVTPKAAWELMLSIFPQGYDTSSYNPKPRWRDFEVEGEAEPVTNLTIFNGANELAERLLSDAGTSAERWAELIDHLGGFPPQLRGKAWARLAEVSSQVTEDEQRRTIWAALRKMISHHRSFPDAEWALKADEVDQIEAVYSKFSPADPVLQRSWLFGQGVPLLQGSLIEQWESREKELTLLQTKAVAELLAERGSAEVQRLAQNVKMPRLVGIAYLLASPTPSSFQKMLKNLLENETVSMQEFASGLAAAANYHHGWAWSESILSMAIAEGWSEIAIIRFLLALPSDRRTWDCAASIGDNVRRDYWQAAQFFLNRESVDDALYAIEQMIGVGRAPDVVERIAGSLKGIPTSNLVKLLSEAAKSEWPRHGNEAVMFQWGVAEILKAIEADDTVKDATTAQLEWMYLAVLEHSQRTPIVLHRFMATNPSFFVQVLSAIFRAHSESAPNDRAATEREQAMATQAFRLLESWRTMPAASGTEVDAEALTRWVAEAHRLAVQAERGAVGDQYIGRILSFSPVGGDGAWPHEAVRNVIEEMRNTHLENGLLIGVHNQQGVTSRGMLDGGTIERDLAKKYNDWSKTMKLDSPRTSAALREIARSFENTARHHDELAERTDWEY